MSEIEPEQHPDYTEWIINQRPAQEPTDRDIHFKGFADLLLQELEEEAKITVVPNAAYDYVRPIIQMMLARRLFDFAEYVQYHVDRWCVDDLWHQCDASDIPDLTAWPDEQEE